MERTALILERFRSVADEIICVIDSRASLEGMEPLAAVADRCLRTEVDPVNTERLLAWIHGQCSGDWILPVDNDEPPSTALIEQLPSLIASDDVAQYLVRRLWVWPNDHQYIDEYPWSDDFQIRLVRNDPKCMRFSGGVHTSAELVVPHGYVEAPLYHLDCLINPFAARRAKAERYEVALPGVWTPRGFPLNGYFFPEEFTSGQLGSVPTEDIQFIRDVCAPSVADGVSGEIPLVPFHETDPYWALRPIPESAHQTRIELLEPVTDMEVQEHRTVAVRVHNLGSERWPWGDFWPAFRMGCRWFEPSDGSIAFESGRTLFSADIVPGVPSVQKIDIVAPPTPGEYQLEVNVLQEAVSWCEGGWRGPVTLHPKGDRPRPKWLGMNPAAAPG